MLAQGSNVAPNHWLHLSGKSLPHLGKRASLGEHIHCMGTVQGPKFRGVGDKQIESLRLGDNRQAALHGGVYAATAGPTGIGTTCARATPSRSHVDPVAMAMF